MLKAVIFDVDGTLAETEEVHREAFNTVFERVGLGWYWSPEEYCELLKVFGGKERIRHFVETESIDGISDEDILELHRLKTSLYAELLPRTAKLRPGVERLIQECLSRSVRLAIATTTTESNVVALDRAVGGSLRLDAFDVVVGGNKVPQRNPIPWSIRLLCRNWVSNPLKRLRLRTRPPGLRRLGGQASVVLRLHLTTRPRTTSRTRL